jgi:hypothetical protein
VVGGITIHLLPRTTFGYVSELAETFVAMRGWPGSQLRRGDGDRAGGVLGEGGQVARVAGEHHRVGGGAGVGGDDGVCGGDLCGLAGGGAQP